MAPIGKALFLKDVCVRHGKYSRASPSKAPAGREGEEEGGGERGRGRRRRAREGPNRAPLRASRVLLLTVREAESSAWNSL